MRKLLVEVVPFMIAGLAVWGGAWGCGGSAKEAGEPTAAADTDTAPADDAVVDGSSDETLIPAEKFDEIKRTFERKQTQISRCFVAGVEAKEIEKTAKGAITVTATIQPDGKAKNVRVVESSFESPALDACVKETVNGWLFTTLPKPLDYSYQYRLERF